MTWSDSLVKVTGMMFGPRKILIYRMLIVGYLWLRIVYSKQTNNLWIFDEWLSRKTQVRYITFWVYKMEMYEVSPHFSPGKSDGVCPRWEDSL